MSDKSIAAPIEFRKPTNPGFIDLSLSEEPFGQLTVIEYRGSDKDQRALWLCECSCGNLCVVRGKNIRTGHTQSCGCIRKRKFIERNTIHGDAHSRLYHIYHSMIDRCINPKNRQYRDYGGRGIAVCDDWLSSYEAFRDWALSHGYADDLTIERDDVNGSYSPGNCLWIPKALQGRNRRNTRRLTAFGETKLMLEWAEDPRCLVKFGTLKTRLADGWPPEKAIATPRVRPPRGGTAGYDR